MTFRRELRSFAWAIAIFLGLYHLPIGNARFDAAVGESLALTKWYAREHVLLCLVPAFFIAGGISVFVSQSSVMRYLGAGARKVTAYGVAATSGTVLAVCSCTVLPLFAGIYGMGAGLGPAIAFLYSGPAINVLANTPWLNLFLAAVLIFFALNLLGMYDIWIPSSVLSFTAGKAFGWTFARSDELPPEVPYMQIHLDGEPWEEGVLDELNDFAQSGSGFAWFLRGDSGCWQDWRDALEHFAIGQGLLMGASQANDWTRNQWNTIPGEPS